MAMRRDQYEDARGGRHTRGGLQDQNDYDSDWWEDFFDRGRHTADGKRYDYGRYGSCDRYGMKRDR